MIKTKEEIKYITINDKVYIQDDIIGLEFVQNFLDVPKSSAYKIIRELRKKLEKKEEVYLQEGTATLGALFKSKGLKGRFLE